MRAAADLIAVGGSQHWLDMVQEGIQRAVEIQNERLDPQCMINLPSKAPLPPENRILLKLLPEACGNHEFNAIALVFVGRGADKQGLRTLGARNLGEIPDAFACDGDHTARSAGFFLWGQYLNSDLRGVFRIHGQSAQSVRVSLRRVVCHTPSELIVQTEHFGPDLRNGKTGIFLRW
jgi:hypothetical protein